MSIGVVGKKCGMTRIFHEDGKSIPVTVVEVLPNIVTQKKTEETDGYTALQITTGQVKAARVNKAKSGHFAKHNVQPGRGLWEFRADATQTAEIQVGDEIKVDRFEEGQFVDVRGISKGKGFAGVVKRHNFSMQDASHGNSLAHRAPGSIGQCQTPGRVFKGKKMAGQMGNKQCSVQNQQIVRVDVENNLILIRGALPGAIGGTVIVLPTVKTASRSQ